MAPHQQFNDSGQWLPVPQTRYENLFPGLKAPRTPNFNPENQDKPSWVGELARMNEPQIAYSDETYRRRAQALAGIEEMVKDLLDTLKKAGQLEDTYIIFSADHGYHVGQHRVIAGKTLPYREDTHVPFFIRGPGVHKGTTLAPSTHVDIATTILSITGLSKDKWPVFLDGRDLSEDWQRKCKKISEVINIEFWGSGIIEGPVQTPKNATRTTYKTVGIVGENYGYLYSYWCTNETEIYDTQNDPYELTRINPSTQPNLTNRLNGLLLVTKTCFQDSCRNPWRTLHPDGTVDKFKAALDSKHDAYYASLPKVSFQKCLAFQNPPNEEPFFPGFDPRASYAFAKQFRTVTDKLGSPEYPGRETSAEVIPESVHFGAVAQDLETIEKDARVLTDEELSGKKNGRIQQRSTAFYGQEEL